MMYSSLSIGTAHETLSKRRHACTLGWKMDEDDDTLLYGLRHA